MQLQNGHHTNVIHIKHLQLYSKGAFMKNYILFVNNFVLVKIILGYTQYIDVQKYLLNTDRIFILININDSG